MKKNYIEKLLSFILISFILSTFISCKKEVPKEEKAKTSEFDLMVAQNIVDIYMKELMKDNLEGAKKFYSSELAQKTKEEGESELKVKGYSIDETSEIGESGFFKLKVARMNLNKPVATLDDCSIKVKKEGSEYKIDEVKNEIRKEAFLEDNTIRVRNKNNVKTNLLADISSFPQYIFSKDDKGNLSKQLVPKDKFSVINFGYEGERIAVSTYDKDSFVGIIKIDESMAAQGGKGGGGQGDKGSQSQDSKSQGGQGEGSTMAREQPIGKEMLSLDLIKDAKIEFMSFSNGEKFVLVQYNKNNNGRCIRVYNTDSGELIPFKFEEKYPYGKVEIVFSSFDKDFLNYEVIQKDMSDESLKKEAGKYQLDLKKFKEKKV